VKLRQDGLIILKGPDGGTPCPGLPTVEYAGKTYNTVQIGSQCWLRENLDVGTMVLGAQEQTDNTIVEKYCYGDDTTNCAMYGALYQWNEAVQYDTAEGGQGICPPGWHMPALAELQALNGTVGGDGNTLKAIDQGFGAGVGTNTSSFSALLAGFHHNLGGFWNLGLETSFWSSVQNDASSAQFLNLNAWGASFNAAPGHKNTGISVRCVKD
jgi:uncharacterized protein (TIGR02145 family)